MKGKIKIMLAENQLGQQMMSYEGNIEDATKDGVFAIMDCMMQNFKLTKAEMREFAVRVLFGSFKHKPIDRISVETNSEEHRAYKAMMERMLE